MMRFVIVLPITLNPYFDSVLREHVVRAARSFGVPLEDLERAFEDEAQAIEFLEACGPDVYGAYIEDSSAAVDHVGWILVDKGTGYELPA